MPRRLSDFAVLPKLPPLAQWHLLEASFQGMREAGPASFAPALGAMAAYVMAGHTWFLVWMMASLGAVVVGQRAAAAFELRTSDSLPGQWARRHAVTAWCQAGLIGTGGFGATLDHNPQTCLLVAFPLGFAIVQAGAKATLVDSVRGQIVLLSAPLVATCLLSQTPLFAVIAALFALQAVAASSLADSAVGNANILAQSEASRIHAPLASHAVMAPAAADFQRLLGRDQSTGLPNRHSFMQLLAEESARAVRAETQLSILLLHWEEFDMLRDEQSQARFETVPGVIARRLRITLRRPADILASLGSGRFAVLLAYTDAYGAATVARNLQEALGNAETDSETQTDLPAVPVSIGIATYCGKGPLPDAQLMQFAEEALQNARRAGYGKIRRYDPLMTTAPPPPYQGGRPSETTGAAPRPRANEPEAPRSEESLGLRE